MGEYNGVIKYYQLSWWSKLAIVKSLKAEVSSISPSSERLEELWVMCLYAENGATLLVGIWWWENNNKLEVLCDIVGIKSVDLKGKFLFSSFAAFQTA